MVIGRENFSLFVILAALGDYDVDNLRQNTEILKIMSKWSHGNNPAYVASGEGPVYSSLA
jgi:hypothetical protein